MKKLGRFFILIALLAATAAVQAQIVETGTITGVVRDNSGAVIPKAQVTIRNKATGLANATATDSTLPQCGIGIDNQANLPSNTTCAEEQNNGAADNGRNPVAANLVHRGRMAVTAGDREERRRNKFCFPSLAATTR